MINSNTTAPSTRSSALKTAKKVSFIIALICFLVGFVCGLLLRNFELEQHDEIALNVAKAISDTALADPSLGLDETILKVSDLFLIESVLGVKLIAGRTIPISVGETKENFPDLALGLSEQIVQNTQRNEIDVALKLPAPLPFDWFVLRLDSTKILNPSLFGTLVSWLIAPFTALIVALSALFILRRFYIDPLEKLEQIFEDKENRFYLNDIPKTYLERQDPWGNIARLIDQSKKPIKEDKARLETQVSFLNETPYPLLRCSVNRKVLFANAPARALLPLFGDETLEFVSPALSEVIRKAFYDSKEIRADIRLGEYIMSFRAVPVLNSGYVNLYGEHSRKDVK